MGRTPRPMPPSVWYVLIILVLQFLVQGDRFLSSLFSGRLLLALLFLMWAVLAGALAVAMLVRQRLAWQWGRLVGALGGGLLFFASSIPLVVSLKAGAAADVLSAGAPMVVSFLMMGMCYAMSRRAALEYFDLICPACGEESTKADDFFFSTVRCTACRTRWRKSAEYVPPKSPFEQDGPLDVLPVVEEAPRPPRPAPPVLDVLPAVEEGLTTAPRRTPAPVDWATDLRAAPNPDKGGPPVPTPGKANSRWPLVLGLGAVAGLALLLLLVCGGGVLYLVMPIAGAKPAAVPTVPDVSPNWVVVFRSRDPKLWNREVNRGPDDFAHRTSSAPEGVGYLRLTNTATGDFVIIPVAKEDLPRREEDKRYGWDGENFFEYEGHHLGIFDSTWHGGRRGEIFVCGGPHFRGWGFGHVIVEGDRQGYSWAAEPIAPTVFEIAVKSGPLTKYESTKLLVGR